MLYVGAAITPLVPSWVGNAESLLSCVCVGLPPQGGEGAVSEHAHHVGWFVSALFREHFLWEALQYRGSSSIHAPGILQANDETVGSPGSMN